MILIRKWKKEKDKKPAATSSSNQVNMDELDEDLMQDAFFQEYIKQKFEEMQRKALAL